MRAAVLHCLLFVVVSAQFYAGVTDTVGGTTFDNQGSGPAMQWVARDSRFGIHAAWMYSQQGSTWPDRNIRYNFFEFPSGGWNWSEPADFMARGMDVRSGRCGYGTLDVVPEDGAALIACHYAPQPMQFEPTALRDMAAGAGIFDECVGAPNLTGYFLPVVAATPDRKVHLIVIKFQASDNLYYARSVVWGSWEEPECWSVTGAFGHNLVASRASSRLLATWMTGRNESLALSYRVSTDAGSTWGDISQLVPPSAFGPDTQTVCFGGANGLFDAQDNWLIVTVLVPVVADSAYMNPAQLWFYNSGTSEWHMVRRAGSANLAGGFGSNAAICNRPSLGRNPASGRLFIAWEEFDSLNVEPSTGLLRADIWVSQSTDGASWADGFRLTEPDFSSKRFPCISRECSGDSLAVGFLADSIAGFNSDGVGLISRNPVCVWHGSATGIAEERQVKPAVAGVTPSVGVRFAIAGFGQARHADIYDAQGRLVRSVPLAQGRGAWDGLDVQGRRVEPGCYFVRVGSGEVKLVVAR